LCGYIRFHSEGAPPSRNAVVKEIMYVEEIWPTHLATHAKLKQFHTLEYILG